MNPAEPSLALLDPSLDWAFRDAVRITHDGAWTGHIPFASWITAAARPGTFVELGTFTGVSFAAFCAGAQAAGVACRCVAVDTWEGDGHVGAYGGEIHAEFAAFAAARFDGAAELLRMRFDAALPRFADGSIDLLHIDGFHTYEAVRHDFDTWLPKLSARGVVLLHDIEVRTGDFGVHRLWAELRERYPGFGFTHSHGLGVLLVGPDAPDALRSLCTLPPEEADRVRQRFASLGRRFEAESELERLGAQKRALEHQLAMRPGARLRRWLAR